MNKELVSVIIPAYNRDKYIKTTVDSVLNQTYENIELIVVDDGSTDDTYNVLENYAGKIKLFTHENRINKGQSASINLGLKKAAGVFVAVLDSDDYWDDEKIEKQVNYLNNNPDIELVYTNGQAVNSSGKYLYDVYSADHVETNRPEDVLLDCYFWLPTNSLVKKTAYDKAGLFDETLRSAQDHDMAIRISEVVKKGYLDEKLFFYRRHEDSISSKSAKLRWMNGFYILKKGISRHQYPKSTIRKRKAVLHFRLFQCLREEQQYFKCIYHLMLSGLLDPLRSLKVILGLEQVSSPH